jgi:hypothetical protein
MVRVLARNLAPSITVNAVALSTILPEPGRSVSPEAFAQDIPWADRAGSKRSPTLCAFSWKTTLLLLLPPLVGA